MVSERDEAWLDLIRWEGCEFCDRYSPRALVAVYRSRFRVWCGECVGEAPEPVTEFRSRIAEFFERARGAGYLDGPYGVQAIHVEIARPRNSSPADYDMVKQGTRNRLLASQGQGLPAGL
jgi:hypothetical protein